MKKAIYGGSFDPLHLGHLRLARTALEQLDVSELTLIPAAVNPFKDGARATAEQRLEMCRLAVRNEPKMNVSDIEIAAGGLSYTYKTVEKLSEPGTELFLVMGADAFCRIFDWKYPQLILQRVILAAGCRNPGEEELLKAQADKLAALGVGLTLLRYEPLPVSSTEIRALVAEGKSTDGLLDPAVRRYIDKNEIYM